MLLAGLPRTTVCSPCSEPLPLCRRDFCRRSWANPYTLADSRLSPFSAFAVLSGAFWFVSPYPHTTSPYRCLDCRVSILPQPTYRANPRRWCFRTWLRISFPRSPPSPCGASLRFRSCFPCRQIHAVPNCRFHFPHKSGSTTFYLSFLQSLLPLICFLLSIRGNRCCDICCAQNCNYKTVCK